ADICAPIRSGVDRGANLIREELVCIDRIVGGGYATADHDLDLAGSEHQLLAHASQHLRHAVHDRGYAGSLGMGNIVARATWHLIAEPEVAVPGGLRNHRARREYSWPR